MAAEHDIPLHDGFKKYKEDFWVISTSLQNYIAQIKIYNNKIKVGLKKYPNKKFFIAKSFSKPFDAIQFIKKYFFEEDNFCDYQRYYDALEVYKDYEEGYNSYNCSVVGEQYIELAKKWLDFMIPIIKENNDQQVEINISSLPDSGNIRFVPTETSRSGVGIWVFNNKKNIELSLEFEDDNEGKYKIFAFKDVSEIGEYLKFGDEIYEIPLTEENLKMVLSDFVF